MASLVVADCMNCGFRGKSSFGMLKQDGSPFQVSALMEDESGICTVTLGDRHGLRTYLNSSLHKKPWLVRIGLLSESLLEWGSQRIYRKHNYCPRCKEYTLSFSEIGSAD